jgi:hypothetical protein
MGQIVPSYPLGKASGIAVYDNLIEKEFLSNFLIALSEDFETLFAPGPTIGGVDPFIKLCSDTNLMQYGTYGPHLRNYDTYCDADRRIKHAMWSCVSEYIQSHRHLWFAPHLNITGARIQKYQRNSGYYREHCDGLPWLPPTLDKPSRILAAVMYLNTVEDGGGTIFPEHDYTSEPIAGRLVLFPSSWQHPHLGAVPLSGDKWVVSSFITTRWSDENIYPFETFSPNEINDGFVEAKETNKENPMDGDK